MFTFIVGLIVGSAVTYLVCIQTGALRPFWIKSDDELRTPSKYKFTDPDVARDLDDHDREMAALDPRWSDGERGDFARFTYADRDGVVTERQISNWRSYDAYIEGFCLNRREGRTFRKDRIAEWSSASEGLDG